MNCPMCKTPCNRFTGDREHGVAIYWRCPKCSTVPVDYSRIGLERGNVERRTAADRVSLFECIRLFEQLPDDYLRWMHGYMVWGWWAAECAQALARHRGSNESAADLENARRHLRTAILSLFDPEERAAAEAQIARQQGGTDAPR